MQKRALVLSCSIVLSLLAALPALAADEGKPPVYNYIAEWAVPREQWRDMAKVSADEKTTMDKLVADGTIIGYGDFTILLHQEGQPTHGSWFTATSRAGLLKALEAIYALPQVTFPVLGASKHWDFLTVSRMYNSKPGTIKGGYLAGGGFDPRPGREKDFTDLMKKSVVPLMDKLLADGTINFYAIETEEFHSQPPGHVVFVYIAPDATGIDKVEDALAAAIMNDPALESAFHGSVEWKGHHDFLARVGNMVNK